MSDYLLNTTIETHSLAASPSMPNNIEYHPKKYEFFNPIDVSLCNLPCGGLTYDVFNTNAEKIQEHRIILRNFTSCMFSNLDYA